MEERFAVWLKPSPPPMKHHHAPCGEGRVDGEGWRVEARRMAASAAVHGNAMERGGGSGEAQDGVVGVVLVRRTSASASWRLLCLGFSY